MQFFIQCLALLLISTITSAASLQPLWQVDGFKMPESVVYDSERKQFYVSNVNGKPLERDHNGSISVFKEGGRDLVIDWVTGLSSPKGMDLLGNKLYVADVKELVVIDVDKAQISARYPLPESKVLNGISVTKQGDIYVSDWMGNRIYILGQHGLEVWLEDDNLQSPNGLYATNKYLYVGAWGDRPRQDFSTETSGSLKRISLQTKKLETVSKGDTWMNLDGIHKSKTGDIMATDFMKGQLLSINKAGKLKEVYPLEPSAADFYYVAQDNLVVVPYLMGQKVVAYTLK